MHFPCSWSVVLRLLSASKASLAKWIAIFQFALEASDNPTLVCNGGGGEGGKTD
jgi:hypothetical protein